MDDRSPGLLSAVDNFSRKSEFYARRRLVKWLRIQEYLERSEPENPVIGGVWAKVLSAQHRLNAVRAAWLEDFAGTGQ